MSEVVIFADLVVNEEHVDAFEERFHALVKQNREEAGNVAFEVHAVADTPGHYCVYEVWRDQDAFEEHFALPRVQGFLRWMETDGVGETTRLLQTKRCWA